MIVGSQDGAEVKTVDQFLHVVERAEDPVFDLTDVLGGSMIQPTLCGNTGLDTGDPAFDDRWQCIAIRAGLGREIFHQFPVGRNGLISGTKQPAFGGEIRIRHHELAFQGVGTHELQQKTFTTAKFTDDKTNSGAAFTIMIQVAFECGNLWQTPNGDMPKTGAGDHAGTQ